MAMLDNVALGNWLQVPAHRDLVTKHYARLVAASSPEEWTIIVLRAALWEGVLAAMQKSHLSTEGAPTAQTVTAATMLVVGNHVAANDDIYSSHFVGSMVICCGVGEDLCQVHIDRVLDFAEDNDGREIGAPKLFATPGNSRWNALSGVIRDAWRSVYGGDLSDAKVNQLLTGVGGRLYGLVFNQAIPPRTYLFKTEVQNLEAGEYWRMLSDCFGHVVSQSPRTFDMSGLLMNHLETVAGMWDSRDDHRFRTAPLGVMRVFADRIRCGTMPKLY